MTEKRRDIRQEVADKWPRFNKREQNRIASLIDRKEHLEMKLTERPEQRLHYWQSEASALEWVLNTIIPDYHSVLPESDYPVDKPVENP